MSRSDFDFEEREFQREIVAALGGRRGTAGRCPTPGLLMAARAGVPFDGAEAVERHALVCLICAQLVKDLGDYEFPGASDAEDRRIRARWQTRGGGTALWLRGWRLPAAAAVAAAILLLAILSPRYARRTLMAPGESARQTAPAQAGSGPPETGAFTLAKPAVKLPALAVLTYRGHTRGAKTYLAELAAALEPYRRDEFADAARHLALLVQRYPNAAEPAFYEGVSQLFLNQNEAAVSSLEAARRQGSGTLEDDISWYLGLAFHRAGRMPEARREFEALCRSAGEYKARACAAAELTQR
jgi:tetratricopeptide (TPR) repeat protein